MSIKALIFLIIIPLKTVIMETPFNYIKSINSMAITEKKMRLTDRNMLVPKVETIAVRSWNLDGRSTVKGKKEKSPVTCCNKRSAMCYMYVM